MTNKAKSITGKIINGVLIATLGLLFWFVTRAESKVDTVATKQVELEKVQIAQSECNKYIVETMKEIKDDVKEIKKAVK